MAAIVHHKIHGIRCTLRKPTFIKAIRHVLKRITCKRDRARILARVRLVCPSRADEGGSGRTLGEWVLYPEPASMTQPPAPPGGHAMFWKWNGVGRVELNEDITDETWEAIAIVAHEFGHVAARQEDANRRGGSNLEWVSESLADYYAFKWGFAREIRKHAKSGRSFGHHGTLPGKSATQYYPDLSTCVFREGGLVTVITSRMTRGFYYVESKNTVPLSAEIAEEIRRKGCTVEPPRRQAHRHVREQPRAIPKVRRAKKTE